MLLALDTATSAASIALYDGEFVLAELNWRTQRRHTRELAPQVDRLLGLVQVTPEQLTGLAVGLGPGSYTGTRIALSYAKGLVAALALPLVGVSSLDVLAYLYGIAPMPVCALVAMGRGRYAWALYATDPWADPLRAPQRLTPYRVGSLEEISSHLQPPVMFVGELDTRGQEALRQLWDGYPDVVVSPPAWGTRRAGALAELAWLRWHRGAWDDPATLSPIYLK